ncbi:MAG TPA: hypothetical protein VGZ26_10870, partial [Pirellulales bacterium]|nr:hypothetical protein [Pirellulales bacterium]
DKSTAETWQREKREKLIALLRVPTYEAASSGEKTSRVGALEVTSRLFKIGAHWTVPALDITAHAEPGQKTAIIVGDAGRAALAGQIDALLQYDYRVLAVDPLLWGESKVKAEDPDYLYPLFVASIGQRPLGIQAAQLAAIARWAHEKEAVGHVKVVAWGPRASMAALVATVVEPAAIIGSELFESFSTLQELIDGDKTVETLPELFAFGLLAEFDIRQIVALAAPRSVIFKKPKERARRELAPLEAWYGLFGVNFKPAN